MNYSELQDHFYKFKKLTTGRIKALLFKHGIKPQICESCNVGKIYNKKPLILQLHHINGNNQDNDIKNLQILCPNCHSQTQTFRSKKKITEQDIVEACKESCSVYDVVKKLNRYPSGHLYKLVEGVIEKNNIPIKKYNYSENNKSHNNLDEIPIKRGRPSPPKVSVTCKHCQIDFIKKKPEQKFCSLKCNSDSQIKHRINEEEAMSLIKKFGWVASAKMLKIDSKYPGNNLKLIIKRYLKNNNLNIDINKISAFSHQSRYKD